MALCPKCGTNLGLRTSFALSNVWGPRGVLNPGPRLEFECFRCGTVLTYPYQIAGLCWVLALLPLMFFSALLEFGQWSSGEWMVAILFYELGLAVAFSVYAKPMIAREGF